MVDAPRLPLPPFNREAAVTKVRLAEDAWNTREPKRVAMAYTPDSRWRNRAEFPQGREEIQVFLTRKWAKDRKFDWPQGRRPDDHPSLSDLGL